MNPTKHEDSEDAASSIQRHENLQLRQFPCSQCGGRLNFVPDAASLVCEQCGHSQEVTPVKGGDQELDFNAWLEKAEADGRMQDVIVVRCPSCAASVEPERATVAMSCPFCGINMDLQEISQRQIKPSSLLPFKVDKKQAREHFVKWVTSRWFAPNQLKKAARSETPLSGLYIPYWTFDTQTQSDYRGQRGIHYQTTETYTAIEDGRSVQKTRTVTRTRWTATSGRVFHGFNDVLVVASSSLPKEITNNLEPWDLQNLVAYNPEYISGFRAQSYQLGLVDGFDYAKERMAPVIQGVIRRDIGGDEQRIDSVSTRYSAVTFKHILLPIWISSYRFGKRSYRFLVNGRTSEVQGERPYSWIKIILLIVFVAAVSGVLWYYYGR